MYLEFSLNLPGVGLKESKVRECFTSCSMCMMRMLHLPGWLWNGSTQLAQQYLLLHVHDEDAPFARVALERINPTCPPVPFSSTVPLLLIIFGDGFFVIWR